MNDYPESVAESIRRAVTATYDQNPDADVQTLTKLVSKAITDTVAESYPPDNEKP